WRRAHHDDSAGMVRHVVAEFGDDGGVTTLADVPAHSDRRLAVRATADAQRWLRGGHPWLYEGSITSVSHEGAPGDLAVVFDSDRDFLAIGLWDPTGPIRVRILHAGSPTKIDDDWWFGRVATAVGRRAGLIADPATTGFRLIHGENDGLPGIVVDAYGPHLVVKIDTAAALVHLRAVLDALSVLVEPSPASVLLRTSRSVDPADLHGLMEGAALRGETPDIAEFLENGLAFGADLRRGQKTGHFLDQRDNRVAVGAIAGGRRVLDVFSCTGGFGVHAAAGGATSVTFVDQSVPALAAARANMARNAAAVGECRVDTVAGDAFVVLEDLRRRRERFDIVVVDPPSFARRASEVDGALEAHRKLTGAALDVLAPGGCLVQASCSSRINADTFTATVVGAAREHGRALVSVETTGHPVDHPVGFPEGAYLAAVRGTAP
ncbi:MAG: class I SAM-dependent methyltransferase, partial [Acidimicrobiales bacterium]